MMYLRHNPHREQLATGMRKRRQRSRTACTIAVLLSLIASDAVSQGTTARTAEGTAQPEAALRPFYVNFNRFVIPFSVDQTGQRPVEVQLYVSRDAGAQWELYATQETSGKPFAFEADSDGNYWFATRTVDEHGNSAPMRPQLAIRVDTAKPRVQLQAGVTEQELVKFTLVCDDAAPSAEAIRVEYSIDQPQQWKPVNDIAARFEPDQAGRLFAAGEFLPAAPWQQIWMFAEVRDLAGNLTTVTQKVERPRMAAAHVRLATTKSPSNSPISPSAGPAAAAELAPQATAVAAAPSPWAVPQFSVSSGVLALEPPNQSPAVQSPVGPPPVAQLPSGLATDPAAGPTGPALAPPVTVPSEVAPPPRPKTAAEAMRPLAASVTPVAPVPTPTGTATGAARPAGSAPSTGPAVVEARRGPAEMPAATEVRPAEQTTAGPSSGMPVRHSSSRKFSLEYEVESGGLVGLSEVELWGTTDFGQTWKRWGTDPDRQSPFDIETNNDGTYGFRVVVVANNGLKTPSPLDGDPADILIAVDTELPRVRISGATYGEAEQTGSLVIRYQCSDTNLARRPISLAFSSTPSGPWSTIAAGLENDGLYVWPADPTLPRQIYLRIDAADLAGNAAHYVLDTPIDIQGLAPRARIRGFNPLTGSAGATTRTSVEEAGQTSSPPLTATQPSARLK